MAKIITAAQAAAIIKDGDTVAFGGFLGSAFAEEIACAIGSRYRDTGSPVNLSLIFAAGQGSGGNKGLNHLAQDGLISKVVGAHFALCPGIQRLIMENKAAGYNLPLGAISHLFRDMAGRKPGTVTHVGLKTFVDPRLEGGKLNSLAEKEDVVELISIGGQERLFYRAMPVDVAVLYASYADTHGNISFEHESVYGEALSIAQAAKANGGKVIVQVEEIVEYGSLKTRLVKIPGVCVDAVVKSSDESMRRQTNATFYNPAFSGEVRVPLEALPSLPMSERKIIARRAAMELPPDAVVNLGIGVPEGVAAVSKEEGISQMLCLTAESGTVGGVPAGGGDFGSAANPDCILDEPYQFDYYDGGNLDMAFIGLAETDERGNVNVSRFGTRVTGCGGFINITQNAQKAVFCGSFTVGGLKVHCEDGRLIIDQEGKNCKFVKQVQQVTFAGDYAREIDQPVLYVTERAVFRLSPEGMELIEIAPGIDLKKDVIDLMGFTPIMKDVRTMDERIFRLEKMVQQG